MNGLSIIRKLIRNKEKTILEIDTELLVKISEKGITDADRYTFDIQILNPKKIVKINHKA